MDSNASQPLPDIQIILLLGAIFVVAIVFFIWMNATGRKYAPKVFALDDCDWLTMSFLIHKVRMVDGMYHLYVIGKVDFWERLVALEICIPGTWGTMQGELVIEGDADDELRQQIEQTIAQTLSAGTVTLKSVGRKSNLFLRRLNKKFGAGIKTTHMKATPIKFGAICLGGDPDDLPNSPVTIKLFADEGAEENYAEIIMDVDLPNKRITFSEKDTDWRKPLVRYLAQ